MVVNILSPLRRSKNSQPYEFLVSLFCLAGVGGTLDSAPFLVSNTCAASLTTIVSGPVDIDILAGYPWTIFSSQLVPFPFFPFPLTWSLCFLRSVFVSVPDPNSKEPLVGSCFFF